MKTSLCIPLAALLFFAATCRALAQPVHLPVMRSNTDTLTIVVGGTRYAKQWTLSPKTRPDEYVVPVANKPVMVRFVSDRDSVEYHVKAGQRHDFWVVHGTDSAWTRISGKRWTAPAVFTKAYQKANDRKTSVEIPEVYELLNIVIALTDYAQKDVGMVVKTTPYYREVQRYFAPFRTLPVVALIDQQLKNNRYHPLKMDGYAFEFTGDRITQSKTYDRISWGDENLVRPFIPQLQQFADASRFRKFFAENHEVYDAQVRCYRDTINTGEMIAWLRRNFPTTDYNAFKVIFSPLVGWNQSANHFESNGFKEAQAHVNFPYVSASNRLSQQALNLSRGAILFTELNHSFINPEQEKYGNSKALIDAFANLDAWIDRQKPAGSYADIASCFNEYMNWALISLYYTDHLPEGEERSGMIHGIEQNMKNNRGFRKFPEFDQMLLRLYQERGNKTLADLYPQIISWCSDHKG